MLLAKLGFNAQDVQSMSTVEVNAWLNSYSESLGVKPKQEDAVVSARIPLDEIKKRYKEGQ